VARNPVYSFFASKGSLAPLFLRLALTSIFVFHGCQKAFGWFGGEGWNTTIESMTDPANLGLPYVVAAAVIIVEPLVALSLFFGFLTRLAAFAVVVLMTGALFLVHAGSGFVDIQTPMLVLTSGLALLFFGGGYFSVDRAISLGLLPDVG
jgi:putative oxidoreductase